MDRERETGQRGGPCLPCHSQPFLLATSHHTHPTLPTHHPYYHLEQPTSHHRTHPTNHHPYQLNHYLPTHPIHQHQHQHQPIHHHHHTLITQHHHHLHTHHPIPLPLPPTPTPPVHPLSLHPILIYRRHRTHMPAMMSTVTLTTRTELVQITHTPNHSNTTLLLQTPTYLPT